MVLKPEYIEERSVSDRKPFVRGTTSDFAVTAWCLFSFFRLLFATFKGFGKNVRRRVSKGWLVFRKARTKRRFSIEGKAGSGLVP